MLGLLGVVVVVLWGVGHGCCGGFGAADGELGGASALALCCGQHVVGGRLTLERARDYSEARLLLISEGLVGAVLRVMAGVDDVVVRACVEHSWCCEQWRVVGVSMAPRPLVCLTLSLPPGSLGARDALRSTTQRPFTSA